MKKILLLLTVLLLVFLFTTCSKKEDDEKIKFQGTMEAKVNGKLVIFEHASGYGFYDLDNHCYKNFHQITGGMEFRASNGHTIYLNFKPSHGIGIYNPNGEYHTWLGNYSDYGDNGIFYHQNYFVSETQTHSEEIGSVTITSMENDRYKGTFYFTAVYNGEDYYSLPNIVNITEGKFEILAEGHKDYGGTPCGYE